MSNTIGEAMGNFIADTGFHEACMSLEQDNQVLESGLWNIVTNETATELSLVQAEHDLADCALFTKATSPNTIVCFLNATAIDPSLLDDEPAGAGQPLPKGRLPRALHWLEYRTATSGKSETYLVSDMLGNTGTLAFVTPTYPSGVNGGRHLVKPG